MIKINDVVLEALDLMSEDTRVLFLSAIFNFGYKDMEPAFDGPNLAVWTLIKGYLKKGKPKAVSDHAAIIADSETMTQAQLAKKYGVSQSTINRILKKKAGKPAMAVGVYPSPTPSEEGRWDDIPADIQAVIDEVSSATALAEQAEREKKAEIETAALEEFFRGIDSDGKQEMKPQTENPRVENPRVENPRVENPRVEEIKKPVTNLDKDAENLFSAVYYNAYCNARNEHCNLGNFDWNAKASAVAWFRIQLNDLDYAALERLISKACCDSATIKLGCTFADLKNYINRHKKEVLEYEIY